MRKMRWISAVLLGIMMLCFIAPTQTEAADEFGYYTWDNKLYISSYNGSSTKVVVPSAIKGKKVYGIAGSAFSGKKNIKSVVLPSTLQYVGSYAFKNCTGLEEVNLPLGLKQLWDSAFYNCTSIKKITVSSKELAHFHGIGNVFTNLGKNATYGTEVVFDTSVTQVPAGMFGTSQNVNVRKVTIGKNVAVIGGNAFSNCKKLEVVSIPKDGKLHTITDGAFENCSNVKSIVLPVDLETVGESAFGGMTALRYVDVYAGDMAAFAGAVFENAGSAVSSGITVKFEDTVHTIPENMFHKSNGAVNIQRVHIGKNVLSIGAKAFLDCANLKAITFAEGALLTTIGNNAFGRTGLVNLEIPEGVVAIETAAFTGCKSLQYLRLPKTLATITAGAFSDCTALEYIRVDSESVQVSGSLVIGTFANAGSETDDGITLVFSDTVQSIAEFLFRNDDAEGDFPHIKTVVIGENVASIGDRAFFKCLQLQNLIIENSEVALSIGRQAFADIEGLEYVVLPERVEVIDRSSFHQCSAMEAICIKNPECFLTTYTVFGGNLGDVEKTVIYGHENSAIWDYAMEEGQAFETYVACDAEHKYEEIIPLYAKSCIYDGVTATYCKHCGEVAYDAVPSTGHSYGKWQTDKVSTCIVQGRKKQSCSICGDEVYEALPLAAHKKSSLLTTATATTAKNGQRVVRCTVCGKVISTKTTYKISSVKLSTTTYTYNGKVKKPSVTVKDSKGNKIASNYYTVTYAKGRKNVGKYKVVVKFKGIYSGSVTKTFTIKPRATKITKTTRYKKAFKVKWSKKTTQVTGYQIQYSTSSKFSSSTTKKYTVKSNKTTNKKFTGLKKKKTYYVRIRTYKKTSSGTIYSSWSSVKKVKTK